MCVYKNKESAIRFISILFTILLILFVMPINYAQADDDTLKSATGPEYPPLSVTTDGETSGFALELLQAVAFEIGMDITFEASDWPTIKNKLSVGEIDVLPIVGYTEERDEIFDFSVPYLIMHGNIFVREGSDITTEEDLIDKEIIVMRDEFMHEFATRKNYSNNLILVDTYEDAFHLLSEGKHDAILAQNIVGQQIIKKLSLSNLKPAATVGSTNRTIIRTNLEGFEQKYCFAVKEGNDELLAKLNEGLAVVTTNGTFGELYRKWFPFVEENKLTLWDKIVSSAAVIVPLVTLLLIGAIVITRYQIKKKKEELERSNHTLLMLEAHLIQKQKLESIGTLASGVAHEINNPINGILNYSQIISDITKEKDISCLDLRNNIINFSDEIIKETNRVSTIVSNLLQFSRTDKKSFSRADISTLIDGVLSLINITINRNEIDLIVDISQDIRPIYCRTQQIQQILINLITNAKDALNQKYPKYHENKKIILSASNATINNIDGIRITVEDHGMGIPSEVAKNIFDPFFTTKDRTEGTGLGLSISYNIAHDHNGNLSFESKKGKFTKFHLDLPAADFQEFL